MSSLAEEFLGTLGNDRRVYVPKRIFRLLGLKHGDLVRITVMKAEAQEERGRRK